MKTIADYAQKDIQFYPTPKPLIDKMLKDIEWYMIENILEPSAGKGNIVESIIEKYPKYSSLPDIDCIEIDPNLRAILKNNIAEKYGNVRIVYDDFLSFKTFKKYDLIVMNPPFQDGARHLLKALEMQKSGGSIICILNAQTIKNPHTEVQKALVAQLNRYSAHITFLENAFSSSERKTDVEIALIKVSIEAVKEESDIMRNMKKAENYKESEVDITDLDVTDFIQMVIGHFNAEVGAGIELIKQYNALKPYLTSSFDKEKNRYKPPTLKLMNENKTNLSVNKFVHDVRLKYWEGLLSNKKFISKLTSKLQEEFRSRVNSLADYDFNEFNIKNLVTEMNAQIKKGIVDEIEVMYDRLTAEHSWYPECKNNRHYYDGWKTNIAHKIGKKIILPTYGIYSAWDGKPRVHEAYNTLSDIERILNFLDGNMTREVNLYETIEKGFSRGITKNIECRFFKVTFYKKGTVHLVFTNPDLIDKYNIYIGKNRNWLPPHYGEKRYNDMQEDEKAVIDSFQGEKDYNRVFANKNYYLASVNVPMLESKGA